MTILERIQQNGGSIADDELPQLIRLNCLQQVLVCCGRSHFRCEAQDVTYLINLIACGTNDEPKVFLYIKGTKRQAQR